MQEIPLIERVLEAREVSAVITGPWFDEIQLTLWIPDLRSAPRSLWGDWGPMYSVALDADHRLEVALGGGGSTGTLREVLELSHLAVESPMRAVTRQLTPLVMKVPLPGARGILRIAFDPAGEPESVELEPADWSQVGDRSLQASLTPSPRRRRAKGGSPRSRARRPDSWTSERRAS